MYNHALQLEKPTWCCRSRGIFTIDAAVSYTFRMIATDEAGNESKSEWWITNP